MASRNYFPNGFTNHDAIACGGEDLNRLYSQLNDGRHVWVGNVTTSPTEDLIWDTDRSISVSKLNGVLNVKHYGAKGDWVTDDTTAIQAAIDAAKAVGGGVIYFPPGRYLVTSTLTATASILFRGAMDLTTGNETGSPLIYTTSATIVHNFNGTLFSFAGNSNASAVTSG